LFQIWSRISLEDIYGFIRESFHELQTKEDLIKSSFVSYGYLDDVAGEMQQEHHHQSNVIEEEINEIEPFQDDEEKESSESINNDTLNLLK